MCGAQRSQIQFEDKDYAVYMSFRWVTTTCLRREPQPVTLWLYPVVVFVENKHGMIETEIDICPCTGQTSKKANKRIMPLNAGF